MTTERERFEAAHKHLSLDKVDSEWTGSPTYVHSHVDAMWAGWQAALSAPPGYALVPVEPTPEMIAADLASAICHNQSYAGRPMEVADLLAGIRACWSAMIAAAPKDPT